MARFVPLVSSCLDRRRLIRAATLALGLVLAGCGGGDGGGSSGLPPTVTAPVITAQPSSLTAAPGASASFQVAATGNGLAYQWQRSTNGGLTWTDIAGASAQSYTLAAVDAAMNGHQFHAVIQNPAGIVVSSAATLTVATAPAVSVTQVSAGAFHSLALKSEGTVWAWGSNSNGQLGLGALQPYTITPTQVTQAGGGAFGGITSVSAGEAHSFALRSDGALFAWGKNNLGQLGDGTVAERANPVPVRDAAGTALTGVRQAVAGGGLSAVLKNDGSVWTWGFYAGLSSSIVRSPMQVLETSGAALSGVTRIALGNGVLLALKSDGTVWSWGSGPLGNGSANLSERATPVVTAPGTSLAGIVDIAVGWTHAIAVAADGRAYSWGSGLLGRTTSTPAGLLAGAVTDATGTPLSGVVRAAAGEGFTVLQKGDGTLLAFGANEGGRLGVGSTGAFEEWPMPVKDQAGAVFANIAALSLSLRHTLVERRDGSVWGWGANANGQLAQAVEPATYWFLKPIVVLP